MVGGPAALAFDLRELAPADGEQVETFAEEFKREVNDAHQRLVCHVRLDPDERRKLLIERHPPELSAQVLRGLFGRLRALGDGDWPQHEVAPVLDLRLAREPFARGEPFGAEPLALGVGQARKQRRALDDDDRARVALAAPLALRGQAHAESLRRVPKVRALGDYSCVAFAVCLPLDVDTHTTPRIQIPISSASGYGRRVRGSSSLTNH